MPCSPREETHMNRLQLTPQSSTGLLPANRFATALATAESELGEFPCSVFSPMHYEPGYAYPLVVWLHDEGEDEHAIKEVMPQISMRNYLAIGVRGTLVHDSEPAIVSEMGDSYTWRQNHDHTFLAQNRVLEAIDEMRTRFNVHEDRIFLAGQGAGGTMAFRLAMREPELFAGVASLGGPFPQGDAPLARIADARRLPLFMAASCDDETYPADAVCDDLRLLYAAGMSVTLRHYPSSAPHRDNMLADIDRWVMELIAGSGQTSVVPSDRSES